MSWLVNYNVFSLYLMYLAYFLGPTDLSQNKWKLQFALVENWQFYSYCFAMKLTFMSLFTGWKLKTYGVELQQFYANAWILLKKVLKEKLEQYPKWFVHNNDCNYLFSFDLHDNVIFLPCCWGGKKFKWEEKHAMKKCWKFYILKFCRQMWHFLF